MTLFSLLVQLRKDHERTEGNSQLLFQENQVLNLVAGVSPLPLGSQNLLSFCMVQTVSVVGISLSLDCPWLKKCHLVEGCVLKGSVLVSDHCCNKVPQTE